MSLLVKSFVVVHLNIYCTDIVSILLVIKHLNKNVCTVRLVSVLTKDGVPSCRPNHAQLFREY